MVEDAPNLKPRSTFQPSIKALKERPGVMITDFLSTVDVKIYSQEKGVNLDPLKYSKRDDI